ncbi:uncharacterized protein PAC_11862 [Phialocephala subalpina]|uniref:Heterokaryon incompatibility domain-containing protein n=1 Tax=Phialocephala subalpina TaxID=576137 RepID=A0A1L7XAB8_9HELO|nr:uncharacterized protein PAC_11862 [Phialocephala subalpina]
MADLVEDDFICQPCQKNLRMAVKIDVSLAGENKNGVFVADFGTADRMLSTPKCKLCRLLYSSRIPEDVGAANCLVTSYDLRAFSFLRNYDGINKPSDATGISVNDSIILAVVPATFNHYRTPKVLKQHFWANGYLFCNIVWEKEPSTIAARTVSRRFEVQLAQNFLDYCKRNHTNLCGATVDALNIKLIDCYSRVPIPPLPAPSGAQYVALSYVWGPPNVRSKPSEVSKVVEDAMEVTRALGFRFLWVDKHCIDQNNNAEKHDQMRQMDLVYRGSEVTIIAAAGENDRTGLPGVGSTADRMKDRLHSFMRAGLFTGRDEGVQKQIFGRPFGSFDDGNKPWSYYIRKYLIIATNYTSRDLSHDSDSLNAFAGVMRYLESSKFPTSQLLGFPYLLPSDSLSDSIHLDCISAILCWRHIGGQAIRKRCEFLSWTWAGWAGTVSWTDLFTHENMDIVSVVEGFQCQLDDSTLVQLQDYGPQHYSRQDSVQCALRFSAWLVPPDMISRMKQSNLHAGRSAHFIWICICLQL